MPIRLSGLASGLDTEAIVGALVSAYSYKKDKYVKKLIRNAFLRFRTIEIKSFFYFRTLNIVHRTANRSYRTAKKTISYFKQFSYFQ